MQAKEEILVVTKHRVLTIKARSSSIKRDGHILKAKQVEVTGPQLLVGFDNSIIDVTLEDDKDRENALKAIYRSYYKLSGRSYSPQQCVFKSGGNDITLELYSDDDTLSDMEEDELVSNVFQSYLCVTGVDDEESQDGREGFRSLLARPVNEELKGQEVILDASDLGMTPKMISPLCYSLVNCALIDGLVFNGLKFDKGSVDALV